MRKMVILLTALTVVLFGAIRPVQAGDREDIEALFKKYAEFEDAGDMQAQSQLMTADRTWVGIGGRRMDQASYMKLQQEWFNNNQKAFPGFKTHTEVRDLQIRLLGNVAVASFAWHVDYVIPGDLSPEKIKMIGSTPAPGLFTQVLVKEGAVWKIAHTHTSPLYISND